MTPEQLKASILQYAIQGKLVEQRPEEGTAEELYQKIKEEKQRLIKEGKIKKEKPLPEITDDEKPFDIPESWKWVRLVDIVYNHGQKKPEDKFSYIDISSIDNIHQKLGLEENLIEPDKAPSRARKIVHFGDIIYSTVRPYLHNTCIIDRDFKAEPIASTGFAVFTCYSGILNKYLFYYLISPSFDTYANDIENSKGVAYPAINDTRLYKALIPVPPHKEQHRIVAKIEELLPLIDRYASSYLKLEKFNAKFPEDMKKSILQYAIQGKLVEQRPEEGTAEELYQKIQEEKQRLIAEGKIKKEKPLPEITDDEIPFEIPESWKWVRLGKLCSVCTGKLDANAQNIDGNFPFFTCGIEVYKTLEYAFDCDAILLGGNNASGDYKMHRYKGKFNAYQRVYVIADSPTHTLDYIYRVIQFWLPFLKTNSQGTTTRFIKLGQVTDMLIPLPPSLEQHRIVAKIEELLPYCDQLIK